MKIHVLVQSVVLMPSAELPIIRLLAHVLMDLWVMHSFTVYQLQIRLQNHVEPIRVDPITSAMYMEIMLLYVILVLDQIHSTIHNVAQNVYTIQIVHSIRRACINNVWTHVKDPVVSIELLIYHLNAKSLPFSFALSSTIMVNGDAY